MLLILNLCLVKNNIVYFLMLLISLTLSQKLNATGFGTPTGTAAQSLGEIGSTSNDVFAAQNNQAGLGFIDHFSIGIFTSNRFLVKETSYFHLSSALPTSSGTFGLTVNYRGTSLFNEKQIGIGYGRKIGKSFAIGAQFDYLNLYLSENGQKNLFTFELGIQYQAMKQLLIAAHVYNPLRLTFESQKLDRLRSLMKIGIKYIPVKDFAFHAEIEKDFDLPVQIKLGAEYIAFKKLRIGAGVKTNPFEGYFGVSALLNNLNIGLSGAYHPYLGFSPQASVSYTFKKKEN